MGPQRTRGVPALAAAILLGCSGGHGPDADGVDGFGAADPDAGALPFAVFESDAGPAAADADRPGMEGGVEARPDGGGPPCDHPREDVTFDDAGVDFAASRYPFCNSPGAPCDEIWSTARCSCDDGRQGENFCDVGGTYSGCYCE